MRDKTFNNDIKRFYLSIKFCFFCFNIDNKDSHVENNRKKNKIISIT